MIFWSQKMERLRVRQVIPGLRYQELVAARIIPPLVDHLRRYPMVASTKTFKYPLFVHKVKGYSYYGVMMEQLLRYTMRRSSYNLNLILDQVLVEIEPMWGPSPFPREALLKHVPTMVNITKAIRAAWEELASHWGSEPQYEQELAWQKLEGHPDIVTARAVLDVKTSGNFLKDKMPIESSLQVLAYYALARASGHSIQWAGLVLPFQACIVTFDLTRWDWRPFMQLLQHRIGVMTRVVEQPDLRTVLSLSLSPTQPRIGSHLRYDKDKFTQALADYGSTRPGYPCQMFLQPNQSKDTTTNKISAATLDEAASIIAAYGLKFFTHAPYVFNLCADLNDPTKKWRAPGLKVELEKTARLGGHGVVVHTGKFKELPLYEALSNMEALVRECAPFATPECPLLLETPAGQATETLCTVEELGRFMTRVTAGNEAQTSSLGLCIDTAHVWGAGYDPMDYILQMERDFPQVRIVLIHFNDSRVERGSFRDAHAPPGKGFIGAHSMSLVAQWATARGVEMVHE